MRVLVAMSGGVDSSVAAAIVAEEHGRHRVVGATLKLWGGTSDSGCCSVADVEDARRVADQLGLVHHVFNFADDFEKRVVDPYVRGHADGKTPNPCIECNRHLKFDRLLERARTLGFDAVATGHHARREHSAVGGYRLCRGADPGQGPVLRAGHAGTGPAVPHALSGGRDDQGRRAGRGRSARAAHGGQTGQSGCLLHPLRPGAPGVPGRSPGAPCRPTGRSPLRRRPRRGGCRRTGDRGPAPGHGPRPRWPPAVRDRRRRAGPAGVTGLTGGRLRRPGRAPHGHLGRPGPHRGGGRTIPRSGHHGHRPVQRPRPTGDRARCTRSRAACR